MARHRIRAHYEQLLDFVKEVISLNWKRQIGKIEESLVIWVEAMRQSEDAGKNGWKMVDFRVMMLAVDPGPQQIRRTDCCHSSLSYIKRTARTRVFTMTIHRRLIQ
ncbi:hypothetical protein TNCV_3614931 [Trichonephila clavipes]|nr:hypothetical protein TNCV_3614931 [Trichonephila clavipes]